MTDCEDITVGSFSSSELSCDEVASLGQAAYLVHQRPYRESSVIGEFFTLNYGRLSLLMRGLKRRPHEVLQPFRPLQIEWCGRGSLKILSNWENSGATLALKDKALYCGYYLNELLLRLVPVNEPASELFAFYHHALGVLMSNQNLEPALRMFEKHLLIALGYYFDCSIETDTFAEVDNDGWYRLDIERGEVVRINDTVDRQGQGPDCFLGKTLRCFADDAFDHDPKAVKRLLRYWLSVYLGPKPIQSRALFT